MTNKFFKKFKDVEEQKQAELEVEEAPEEPLEDILDQTQIVLSYHNPKGYEVGIYGEGDLIVFRYPYGWRMERDEIKEEFLQKFKDTFSVNDIFNLTEKIRHIHIYIGGAEERKIGAVEAAVEIVGSLHKVSIYYCSCATADGRLDKFKEEFSQADFSRVDCGGQEDMAAICRRYAQPSEKQK